MSLRLSQGLECPTIVPTPVCRRDLLLSSFTLADSPRPHTLTQPRSTFPPSLTEGFTSLVHPPVPLPVLRTSGAPNRPPSWSGRGWTSRRGDVEKGERKCLRTRNLNCVSPQTTIFCLVSERIGAGVVSVQDLSRDEVEENRGGGGGRGEDAQGLSVSGGPWEPTTLSVVFVLAECPACINGSDAPLCVDTPWPGPGLSTKGEDKRFNRRDGIKKILLFLEIFVSFVNFSHTFFTKVGTYLMEVTF